MVLSDLCTRYRDTTSTLTLYRKSFFVAQCCWETGLTVNCMARCNLHTVAPPSSQSHNLYDKYHIRNNNTNKGSCQAKSSGRPAPRLHCTIKSSFRISAEYGMV